MLAEAAGRRAPHALPAAAAGTANRASHARGACPGAKIPAPAASRDALPAGRCTPGAGRSDDHALRPTGAATTTASGQTHNLICINSTRVQNKIPTRSCWASGACWSCLQQRGHAASLSAGARQPCGARRRRFGRSLAHLAAGAPVGSLAQLVGSSHGCAAADGLLLLLLPTLQLLELLSSSCPLETCCPAETGAALDGSDGSLSSSSTGSMPAPGKRSPTGASRRAAV